MQKEEKQNPKRGKLNIENIQIKKIDLPSIDAATPAPPTPAAAIFFERKKNKGKYDLFFKSSC